MKFFLCICAFLAVLSVVYGAVALYPPNPGDLLDIFTLTNSAINFILYCIMSQKFREVFKANFFPYIPCFKKMKNQWISLQTVNTLVEI